MTALPANGLTSTAGEVDIEESVTEPEDKVVIGEGAPGEKMQAFTAKKRKVALFVAYIGAGYLVSTAIFTL